MEKGRLNMSEQFNAQDYINQFTNGQNSEQQISTPQASGNPSYPQNTRPQQSPPQGGGYGGNTASYQSAPQNSRPNGSNPNSGNFSANSGRNYGQNTTGRGGFGTCHVTGRLIRKKDTNQIMTEWAITRKGWEYLTQNEPGTLKLRTVEFEADKQTVMQTGNGFGETTVGLGWFCLNRKGWDKKNAENGSVQSDSNYSRPNSSQYNVPSNASNTGEAGTPSWGNRR